ncbi:MAG: spondin domain-containing protein [Bacteroidetes bacterium]|nr:spondin domain-containing protein [Bacteroidota bacterium]
MSLKQFFVGLTVVTAILSCKKDIKDLPQKPDDLQTTNYRVTFNINWNNTDYPTDYPSNAHFSKLIGWSHEPNTEFFKEGTLASEGIRQMAELGATNTLSDEINEKISTKEGLGLYVGSNLSTGVGQITIDVVVDKYHPSVTLATMLAPSPDWYLAVVNVNLLENNQFLSSKAIEGLVYDAGTDDGTTYTSPNANTYPRRAISYFVSAPLGNDTVISPAIATVTFTKL